MSIKIRPKPIEIDAIQINDENQQQVVDFLKLAGNLVSYSVEAGYEWPYVVGRYPPKITIETREQTIRANFKDWLVLGLKNEIRVYSPEIFEETFEVVT